MSDITLLCSFICQMQVLLFIKKRFADWLNTPLPGGLGIEAPQSREDQKARDRRLSAGRSVNHTMSGVAVCPKRVRYATRTSPEMDLSVSEDTSALCGLLRFRCRNAYRTGIRTVGNHAFHLMSFLVVLVCAAKAQTRTTRIFSILGLGVTNSTELPCTSPGVWSILSRAKASPLAVLECCSPLVLYSFSASSPTDAQDTYAVEYKSDVNPCGWSAR